AKDVVTGETREIRAKKVVNAAGPWVDEIRELDQSRKGKHMFLTKGVHLVFDQSKFPLQQAVYFDTPFDDGRMMFAIPRVGKTYIGTTDTQYTKNPVHPQMTVEDRDYIVDAANFMFPGINVTKEDVESSWSGVRPLIHEEGKDPSEISRKDEIFLS
ncbi:FAD-dependent oxidoreductase, partial [Staphylococcus sp. SIMBA_130]